MKKKKLSEEILYILSVRIEPASTAPKRSLFRYITLSVVLHSHVTVTISILYTTYLSNIQFRRSLNMKHLQIIIIENYDI